jgi:hypothetical protein
VGKILKLPEAYIAAALGKCRKHLELSRDMGRQILNRCMENAEDEKDYAKRWWRLLDRQAMPIECLLGDLMRTIKAGTDPKTQEHN